MRILNLFAGLGGNRRLWGDEHEVVAVEWDVDVARAYSCFFPDDRVVVDDAHEFLRHNFLDFDFVWSSPPCQSHSRARTVGRFPVFPDLRLYEEVLFLQRYAVGFPLWVVENVVPFYEPLVPGVRFGRHLWWSNFVLPVLSGGGELGRKHSVGDLERVFGFDLSGFVFEDKRQLLRNCVLPEDGRLILDTVEGLLADG